VVCGLKEENEMVNVNMSKGTGTIADIIAYTFDPWLLISLLAPFCFMFFAPKEYIDFVLTQKDIPEALNPRAGLFFIFIASFLIINCILRGIYGRIRGLFHKS